MIQEIIEDFPPLYDDIVEAFGLKSDNSILFSWGDRLYNPHSLVIVPQLIAHEAVHGERQGTHWDIIDWWKRYMDDRLFRLQEEIPAHRAEYEYMAANGNRAQRRGCLRVVANRLAAPLYGRLLSRSSAEAVLRNEDERICV